MIKYLLGANGKINHIKLSVLLSLVLVGPIIILVGLSWVFHFTAIYFLPITFIISWIIIIYYYNKINLFYKKQKNKK